jgi:hypothetical protein
MGKAASHAQTTDAGRNHPRMVTTPLPGLGEHRTQASGQLGEGRGRVLALRRHIGLELHARDERDVDGFRRWPR